MTEPREPHGQDATGAGEHRESADWRGEWKQAADGTWYREDEPAEPQRHDRGHEGAYERAYEGTYEGGHDEAHEPRNAPQQVAERSQPQQPTRTRRSRSKWTTAGFVAVAGLLVFALVRALVGTGNQTVPSNAPLPAPTKPPTVSMGGAQVPTSGPVLTLNPGLVRQGAKVGINGIGFDAGSTVDLQFLADGSRQPVPIPAVTVARDGSFATGFVAPQLPNANGGTITAVQRGSNKGAQAQAEVQGGVGNATLNRVAGRPGDVVAVSGNGFTPGEKVNAYWGRIGGRPAAVLQADQSGGLAQVPVRVGTAPSGNATLVLVGDQSKTTATSSFTMIGLYPNASVTPYAVKAAQPFGVTGSGFVPGERVLLYVGNIGGPPVTVLRADAQGNVAGAQFVAPFQLRGRQTLNMVGEQSRAVANSGFMIMPYTPSAQPSTWGGMPGTSLSFYANGFAPNEVVLVYAGRGQGSPGELVSAFRADGQGNAVAAGQYTIPADAQGQTSVQLVGRQSGGAANVTLSVQGGSGASFPPQPPYVLPPDLAADPVVPGGPPPPLPPPPAPAAPPAPRPTR